MIKMHFVNVILLMLLASLMQACSTSPSMTTGMTMGMTDARPGSKVIEAMLHEHTQVLAADEFGGRAPATPGEELTINYLQAQFADLGIGPGNGDSYFQEVAVTEVTTESDVTLKLKGGDYSVELEYKSEMVVGTQQQVGSTGIADSEMVFVGYGIVAPERGWDDYAGVDVKGKTVVLLVNDPGYATRDPDLFNGYAMTWYGRWVYKYEEAARQGAAAALIVHETGPAGYGWDVVRNSWSGPQIMLTAADKNQDRLNIEGWLTLESARHLFDGAGLDYEELKSAASKPGFKPVPLGDIRASVHISNEVRSSTSRNVIAMIPGTKRPDETIIYSSHWDHLGINPELEGDQIYNGAADNATGTAGLLALAHLHAQQPPPERSIIFLAVTAEESGLLGSKWYAENPIYPIAKTVANINMDNLNTSGRTKDVVVVGYGASELEDYLADAAKTQGRYLAQEPTPERGYYYRSDHFSFARVGVPALYAESGIDSVEHGSEWGKAQAQDYIENRYHQPADEYDPNWDLSGAAEDIFIYFHIVDRLANESRFPNWREGNEFKGTRDASRSGQGGN